MKKLTSKCIYTQKISNSNQSGFSLIEIMIAALVLSIGVLGVAGLQIVSMKGTHQSFMKQQAADLVTNLTERMRSNKQGVIDGNYSLASAAGFNCGQAVPNCSAVSCTTPNIALLDLHNTVCGISAAGATNFTGGVIVTNIGDIPIFSGGELSITCPNIDCTTGDVRIQVQWTERALGEEVAVRDSLIVSTRILP